MPEMCLFFAQLFGLPCSAICFPMLCSLLSSWKRAQEPKSKVDSIKILKLFSLPITFYRISNKKASDQIVSRP